MKLAKKNIFLFFKSKLRSMASFVQYCRFKGLHDKEKILRYHMAHKDQTIFVVVSGPSLEFVDPKVFRDSIVVSVNFSYRHFGSVRPEKHYWFVSDEWRVQQSVCINRKHFDSSFRVLKTRSKLFWWKSPFSPDDVVFVGKQIHHNEASAAGQFLLHETLFPVGGSSIFGAIQLAVYMGAKSICLVGADFKPASDGRTHFESVPLHVEEKKRNTKHEYAEYMLQKYNNQIKPTLAEFEVMLAERGVSLVNASQDSLDDVLRRVRLEDIVKS